MNRFVIDYISKLLNKMVDNIMKHNPDIQNHRKHNPDTQNHRKHNPDTQNHRKHNPDTQNHRKHNPDTQNHRKLEKFELIITAGTSPPLCIFHSIYNKVDF
jgi:hypothetical protein